VAVEARFREHARRFAAVPALCHRLLVQAAGACVIEVRYGEVVQHCPAVQRVCGQPAQRERELASASLGGSTRHCSLFEQVVSASMPHKRGNELRDYFFHPKIEMSSVRSYRTYVGTYDDCALSMTDHSTRYDR
jgi:hypothetical protein